MDVVEALGEDYEDSRELRDYIDDIGIYKVDAKTITLQDAVNHSRCRKTHGDAKYWRIDERSSKRIEAFLNATYDASDVGVVFHKLNYPQDYLWMKEDDFAFGHSYYDDDNFGIGSHRSDYASLRIDDYETWPLYDAETVDIDVESEVNFQQTLQELKSEIGVTSSGSHIDVGLRIPYSQLSKAPSYEIRLIDFLKQLNWIPRITICVCRNNYPMTERASFFVTYLKIAVN